LGSIFDKPNDDTPDKDYEDRRRASAMVRYEYWDKVLIPSSFVRGWLISSVVISSLQFIFSQLAVVATMTPPSIDLAEKKQYGAYSTEPKEALGSESDVEQGTNDVYVVDKKLERRLLWKFDIHILPMLTIMYLFK
jgi:hypothetical protein